MANRIVDNTYIIDSAQGATLFSWNAGARIEGIGAWFANTTGIAAFAFADTTNVFLILTPDAPASGSGATPYVHLGGIRTSVFTVPTLTAGTAYVYFS